MFRCLTCGEFNESYRYPCANCEITEFEGLVWGRMVYYKDGKIHSKITDSKEYKDKFYKLKEAQSERHYNIKATRNIGASR